MSTPRAAQALQQLVAFAVVADDAQGDHAHVQRPQVGDDGTGRAGTGPHLHHLVRLQPGLERDLGQLPVDDQVLVQEEIAHHQDSDSGQAVQQSVKTVLVHGASSDHLDDTDSARVRRWSP